MDLISHPCARCGVEFDRAVDARGQSASWCRPCRRSYNREYMRDYALINKGGHACTVCGVSCWGVRCRECFNASKQKKLRTRTPPRPRRGTARPSNDPRYKALRLAVLTEETACGFCGLYVDQSLPHQHKMSATIDHIVPIALGGDPFSRANVRLAHRSCNAKAGNRAKEDAALERLALARAALWLADRLVA